MSFAEYTSRHVARYGQRMESPAFDINDGSLPMTFLRLQVGAVLGRVRILVIMKGSCEAYHVVVTSLETKLGACCGLQLATRQRSRRSKYYMLKNELRGHVTIKPSRQALTSGQSCVTLGSSGEQLIPPVQSPKKCHDDVSLTGFRGGPFEAMDNIVSLCLRIFPRRGGCCPIDSLLYVAFIDCCRIRMSPLSFCILADICQEVL